MEIKRSTSDYLIAMLRAAIRNEIPLEKPDDVNWDELLKLAVYHKVENLVFYSITKLKSKPVGEDKKLWLESHERAQILDTVQVAENELIIKTMAQNNIHVLPMKGIILKTMYSKSELRQMADLDYLVEPDQMEKIKSIMEQLGYEADDVGSEDSHDVYKKNPYLEVEVHRRLLPPTEENHWHTDGIWNRLVPDKDNPYLMNMTWEDYYLFHLLHFEKHYSMGGSGVKSIIDQYYLMKDLKDKLNMDYIIPNLTKMNYINFQKMCQDLCDGWFGSGVITKELEGPAEFIINSGAFGTFEEYQKWSYNRYKKEQGIKTKKGFFLRRMFMERERMEYIYPSLKKHKWLLPFLWIHRLCKAILFNRGRVKMEMNNFKENANNKK